MAEKKRGLAVLVAVGAFLLYYFVAARPLLSELEFQPRWVASIGAGAPAAPGGSPSADNVLPFKLGNRFGYIDEAGKVLFARESPYGLAFSPAAFSAYEGVHSEVSFSDPYGKELFKVKSTGYPFIQRGRFFIVSNDRAGVAEYDGAGELLWSRDFPSALSCADANGGLFLAGCVTGEAVLVGPDGAALSEFSPGGSRIPCVYGCAVAPDGAWYALLSGVDKQRILLLQKRPDGYKVAWHSYLESDYRRTVRMAFTADSAYLFFEQPGKLALLEAETKRLGELPVVGEVAMIEEDHFNGIYLFLSRSGRDWTLRGFRAPGRQILAIPFSAYQAFLYQRGSAIYLGINESVLRVDMKER